MNKKTETAIFGGGCFWCTEAIFENLKGVISVTPGYAGGAKSNPTYEEVSSGKTGHAEVIKIEFDPEQITYENLLTVFFAVHDPTTINRQGDDVGVQYRSIILHTDEEQKKQAENFIKRLNESEGGRVVTEVKPLEKFYKAEDYHHHYYQKNKNQPYCQIVINPKLQMLRKNFDNLLKSHNKSQ